ncbi:MAG: protein kinase [Myxococcaceae bacterium]|nr:protein kinase [Myxococcaceae bacterium]
MRTREPMPPFAPREDASNPGEAPLSADVQVDGFRVVRLLGEGASGRVYLAQDVALGRRVALKFLRPEKLGAEGAERFLEEARTTARFSHPHIVTVYGAGTFHGQPYLALEYLEGETLRERLARGRLSRAEALRVGWAVADALAEAHAHGIIHADLKPENVLVPRDGRLRVVDFGLARHAGASAAMASGTPAYMSPERWRGAAPAPAMDVWALGVLLHELLEGRRPLEDEDIFKYAFAPRSVSWPALELRGLEMLGNCLALEPAARPTAEEVARALTAQLGSGRATTGGAEAYSPFRGLRSFTEADAADFSGREAEVDALVERLRHEGAVTLVGPSGVGKSSLLHAGLVPRLKQLAPWTVVTLRPGPRPLARLAEALGLTPGAEETLAQRPGAVVEALRARAAGPALLVLDAFEEAFTLAASEEALALARCLAAAATSDVGWRVVITLRDDYLGQYARLEPLRAFLGGTYVVGPLSPPALAEAVAGPLRRASTGTDDPGLVARIVADVLAQPSGLPLLQVTCAALWERRDREKRLLLASVYEELGGVAGALAAQGRQLLGRLPADDVRTVRALLLRLLTSEGTRRPRMRTELLEGLGPDAGRVLDALLAHRLLVASRDVKTDGATVELAHEALATAWPELAHWREESREEHLLVQQIDQAAELWDRRGRRDEETWGGVALSQAVRRVEEWRVPLATRSLAFLEAARQRHRRQVRRGRTAVAGGVALLMLAVLASTAAAFAFRQRQLEAVRQQEQVRLAAADVGAFELLLELHDFEPETQQWTRVPATAPLTWTLTPTAGSGAGTPYGPTDVRRSKGHLDAHGAWREHVEAPSREAWLSVERGPCPPSQVRLRRLPGFAERGHAQELRIPLPTCEASRRGTVQVPAGAFWRPGDTPEEHTRVEVAAFAIDVTEVTNGQFRLFEEGVLPLSGDERALPPDIPIYTHARSPHSPATGLDAATAEAYCRFMGKVQPTVEEWQKAARGGEFLGADGLHPNPLPRRYAVWGELRGVPPANLGGKDAFPGPAPVGSFPEDRSPYGVQDMAGNVTEWTASTATEGAFRGLRLTAGGRWDSPPQLQHEHLGWVNHVPARRFDFYTGLRCLERGAGSR